ncbi:uncharacterized protein LOC144289162 [Canis aureus]
MAPRSKKKRPAAARTPGPARPGPALGTAAGAGAPARCLGVGRELQPRRLLYLRAGGNFRFPAPPALPPPSSSPPPPPFPRGLTIRSPKPFKGDLAAAAGPLPASPPPLPAPPPSPFPPRRPPRAGAGRFPSAPERARAAPPHPSAAPEGGRRGPFGRGVSPSRSGCDSSGSSGYSFYARPKPKAACHPKDFTSDGAKKRKFVLFSEVSPVLGESSGPERDSAGSSLRPASPELPAQDAFLITSSETLLEDLHSGPKELEREEKKTRKEQSENKEEIKREKKECEESERGS